MLYAVLQLGSGIYYHSAWFYTLSGYYVILAVMRYFLLKETRHKELGKNLFGNIFITGFAAFCCCS